MEVFSLAVVVAVCLGAIAPFTEATFGWFTSSTILPSLTLRDECGARVFVAENETTESSLEGEYYGENNGLDINRFTDIPWPWVVRVGDTAVGVLLSQQHVVTLAHCIHIHAAWYGGFNTFDVEVGEGLVEVSRVRVQGVEGGIYPLAVLTLKANLTWIPAPVCVGAMQDGLLAAAVGWGGENILREEPLSLHRKGQCKELFKKNYDDRLMICGGPGPADCGAPLLQADDGRWMLIGVSVGDKTPVARYVSLEPSREWLQET